MTFEESLTDSLYADFKKILAKTKKTSKSTSGESIEEVLREAIRETAPTNFAVGEGFIDKYTGKAKQTDILIWDRARYGAKVMHDERLLRATVKPESVRAIIEVKSQLSSKYLKESFLAINDKACFITKNIEQMEYRGGVKTIGNSDYYLPDIFTGVFFCFAKTNKPMSFEKNLTKYFKDDPKIENDIFIKQRNMCQPVKYFVFDKDVIAIFRGNYYNVYFTENKAYVYFLSILDEWLNLEVNKFHLLNKIIYEIIVEKPLFSIDFNTLLSFFTRK